VFHVGDKELLLIDVRSPMEWSQGYLESAVRVEWQDISGAILSLAEALDQPIVLYCRSGHRSGKAKMILENMGFTRVVNGGSLAETEEFLNSACCI
tara:strand:- start:172 stop:459 length:288 start_codon:yes stop_codon:yes gene_type:complete